MKRTAPIATLAAALSVSVAAPVASAAVEPNPLRYGEASSIVEPNPLRYGDLSGFRYERPAGVRGNFGKAKPRSVRLTGARVNW